MAETQLPAIVKINLQLSAAFQGVGDGQGGLVCCNTWGRKESDMTEWLNWLTDCFSRFQLPLVMYLFWALNWMSFFSPRLNTCLTSAFAEYADFRVYFQWQPCHCMRIFYWRNFSFSSSGFCLFSVFLSKDHWLWDTLGLNPESAI